MDRFRRVFMRSSRELDAEMDEWLEEIKEDTSQDASAVRPPLRRSRGAHRKPSMFGSLNNSRST